MSHYAGHSKELEEWGLLFSSAGQHGKNEKMIKNHFKAEKQQKVQTVGKGRRNGNLLHHFGGANGLDLGCI